VTMTVLADLTIEVIYVTIMEWNGRIRNSDKFYRKKLPEKLTPLKWT